MPPDVTRPTLSELRDAVTELPTIPETLTRILRLLEDPNSGARDLAGVIRGDAPLAGKILRLANSPLYQKNRTITTIQECVAVLGYRTVRQVALCVAVISSLGRECRARDVTLGYHDLWRHSVATGAVARELAARTGQCEPEAALLGGLLHDLGKYVLAICEPRAYTDLLVRRRELGEGLTAIEHADFGFDHAQAGAALADAWNFPPELLAAIGGHHEPAGAGPLVTVVALADHVAHRLQPSASDLGYDAAHVDSAALHRLADLDEATTEAASDVLVAAIESLSPLTSLD